MLYTRVLVVLVTYRAMSFIYCKSLTIFELGVEPTLPLSCVCVIYTCVLLYNCTLFVFSILATLLRKAELGVEPSLPFSCRGAEQLVSFNIVSYGGANC